jgi:hypothetical protein
MSAYQTLGDVDELIARDHEAFAYPEAAVVTPVLSDGTSDLNYVLQSGGLSVRQAKRSWVTVPTADMETLREYSETKAEQVYTEEDGTIRSVIVMDFRATQQFVGYWTVAALLIETVEPAVGS